MECKSTRVLECKSGGIPSKEIKLTSRRVPTQRYQLPVTERFENKFEAEPTFLDTGEAFYYNYNTKEIDRKKVKTKIWVALARVFLRIVGWLVLNINCESTLSGPIPPSSSRRPYFWPVGSSCIFICFITTSSSSLFKSGISFGFLGSL